MWSREKKITIPISLKDEFSERILQKFVALKPKVCTYLADNGHVDKIKKATRICIIKRKIKFEDYRICLENDKCSAVIPQFIN